MSASIPQRGFAGQLRKVGDAWLAVGAVLIIALMSLPIPPLLLDTLLAINIAVGVLLLLTALYVPTPLALSTFPSILLLTTLFRVALNVATTKQILLHAHAGDIIDTFGKLVVGGSLVVGLVVFLVITLVQFIVVAKGAERVAEVGARFNLDALPGKQMSIDSDIRAGVISQPEAFERRARLTAESQFYGAMDGAMKFVKGDAIAGIVIVAINLIGGIAIGVLGKGMPLAEAVKIYSILTIGDGLVSQIPALFVATAAGIVTTRTTTEDNSHLAAQIGRQLVGQPTAMMIAGLVLALFALVPGFPVLVFLALGGTAVALGRYQMKNRQREAANKLRTDIPAAARDGDRAAVLFAEGEQPRHYLPFRLDVATPLLQRLTAPAINSALTDLRHDLKGGLGLPFPGLAIQQMNTFVDNRARLLVQDLPAADFEIPGGAVLALATEQQLREAGLPVEAEFAVAPFEEMRWIPEAAVPRARAAGIATLAGATVLSRIVGEAMLSRVDRLLGVQEVRQMLREVEISHGELVREALSVMPLARLTDLLVELAHEGVPLRDVPAMLQALVSLSANTRDLRAVQEALRLAQARAMVARVASAGIEACVGLSQEIEDQLRAALVDRPEGAAFAVSPAAARDIVEAVRNGAAGAPLVVGADLRAPLAKLLRAGIPAARVLSYAELERAGFRGTPARQIAALKAG